MSFLTELAKKHRPSLGALDLLKYIGPGFLVTVGFIDPGNWASNLAAGSSFGYSLLWVVTLSTIMLIVLQHNVAHLGIVTGLCLSEATNLNFSAPVSRTVLGTAMMASVSTSLAEIMGGAIALNLLFGIPVKIASVMVAAAVLYMLFSNTYRKTEKLIIAFVSVIGLSFIYELSIVDIQWYSAIRSWVVPSIPPGSMLIVTSVLGAVVMPHNLFLHSEIIQSRKWNLEDERVIKKQLKYEFLDTIFSMIVGWAINSAMIILAAAVFFKAGKEVTQLQEASAMLNPLLGKSAALVFSVALLFSGLSSTVTSAMAAASIFAGIYGEPMDLKDSHSRLGVYISIGAALLIIMVISDPFRALIISQAALSIQLPITIFSQIRLTSSKKVMGAHANNKAMTFFLTFIGLAVTWLNLKLLLELFF